MNSERYIDRFDKYMKIKRLNDNQVTSDLDLSVGLLSKSRKEGKDISMKTIEIILKFYSDINQVWFLTGKGEMFNQITNQKTEDPIQSYNNNTQMKTKIEKIESRLDVISLAISNLNNSIERLESKIEANINKQTGTE